MGKDREGKFIPPKGKPSGDGNPKAGLKPVLNLDNLDERNEIADKYTEGPDEPAANIRVSKPNRNVNKDIDTGPAYS